MLVFGFQINGPTDISNFDFYPKDNDIPPDELSNWDMDFWNCITSGISKGSALSAKRLWLAGWRIGRNLVPFPEVMSQVVLRKVMLVDTT